MTKDCLRYAPMIGARPGELPEADAHALSVHLQGCRTCQAVAAEVEATDGLVAEALLARANARDFAPFVDEVMARIGAPRAPASLLARLRLHWRAFAVSAAALVVVAAGAAFMYVRSTAVEEPHERVAAVSMELQGGSTVLETSDGPVVLLEPDDDAGS